MLFGASITHTEQGKEGVPHICIYSMGHEFKLRQLWKDILAVSWPGSGLLRGPLLIQLLFISEVCGAQNESVSPNLVKEQAQVYFYGFMAMVRCVQVSHGKLVREDPQWSTKKPIRAPCWGPCPGARVRNGEHWRAPGGLYPKAWTALSTNRCLITEQMELDQQMNTNRMNLLMWN